MSRANDAYIAEAVFGWQQVRVQDLDGRNRRVWVGCPPGSANDLTHVPHYSASLDKCYEMEARLMELDKMAAYVDALAQVMWAVLQTSRPEVALVHATAQQKVLAAMAVTALPI